MDASTPPPASAAPPNEPPPYVYAAAEYRSLPSQERDRELCRAASHTDWIYIAGTLALDVGAVTADNLFFRFRDEPGVRLVGPSVVGLTWGMTLGGAFLSLPKCDPTWTSWSPPEGNVRSEKPIMMAIGMFAAATAPFIARIEQGPIRDEWAVWERALTVILPMTTGFAGTFVPYLFPPRTSRAADELNRLRLGIDRSGMTVGYALTF